MPSGLWTSPWRTRWTVVRERAHGAVAAAAARAAPGSASAITVERVVVERGGDEARLEHARRPVHPGVEQGVEERREAPGLGGLHVVVVPPHLVGEADRHQRARPLHGVHDPGRGERVGDQAVQAVGVRVQRRVDLGRRVAQRREPGRDRDGVPGQRPGLVDGPGGREVAHDVGAAAERGGGQAAGHDLAEAVEVAGDALEAVPARRPRPGSRSSPRRSPAARRGPGRAA